MKSNPNLYTTRSIVGIIVISSMVSILLLGGIAAAMGTGISAGSTTPTAATSDILSVDVEYAGRDAGPKQTVNVSLTITAPEQQQLENLTVNLTGTEAIVVDPRSVQISSEFHDYGKVSYRERKEGIDGAKVEVQALPPGTQLHVSFSGVPRSLKSDELAVATLDVAYSTGGEQTTVRRTLSVKATNAYDRLQHLQNELEQANQRIAELEEAVRETQRQGRLVAGAGLFIGILGIAVGALFRRRARIAHRHQVQEAAENLEQIEEDIAKPGLRRRARQVRTTLESETAEEDDVSEPKPQDDGGEIYDSRS